MKSVKEFAKTHMQALCIATMGQLAFVCWGMAQWNLLCLKSGTPAFARSSLNAAGYAYVFFAKAKLN